MKIYNNFIIALAVAACFINVLLAFFGQNDIKIYFIINTIAYMVITLLYVYFNPRARKALTAIGAVFFACFMVTVILEVVHIISGR